MTARRLLPSATSAKGKLRAPIAPGVRRGAEGGGGEQGRSITRGRGRGMTVDEPCVFTDFLQQCFMNTHTNNLSWRRFNFIHTAPC